MKFNVKAITAAVVLSCAGTANAAIDNFYTGNGELFLSIRDNVNATSIVLDMNLTMDTFLATTGTSNFSMTDAGISAFLSAGSQDFSWAVMAGDSVGSASPGGLRYLSTTNAADTTIGALNNTTLQGFQAMDTAYVDNVNQLFLGNTNTTGQSTSVDPSYFGAVMDNWSNNANFSATAAVGQSQNFVFLSNSASTILPTGKLALINQVNTGSFTLDANGVLSFTAPGVTPPPTTPLPGALYLLGSALVGLVGVTRRKKKVA